MKARNLVSILSGIALLLAAVAAFAQPPDSLWSRTYGGGDADRCLAIQQTRDGGYVLAGETWSYGAGELDAYLVKTNVDGDSVWSHAYGGIRHEACYSIQETSDGGYILGGATGYFTQPDGETDFWLVKTDSLGSELWSRTFGNSQYDYCYSVQQTSDGGYVLGGYTGGVFGVFYTDFWLVKTDASGDSLWSRVYGGNSFDECTSVRPTTDGGYVLAGYTRSFGAGTDDFWLVKTDANGDSLWSRTFGGSSYDYCFSAQQTADGGYILAGGTESFGSGARDSWLVKTNANGDSLWSRTFGGSGDDWARSVQETLDGGYILAGFTQSFGAGGYDFWIGKGDSNGDSLWSCTFGGELDDLCYCATQTFDGGYILAGKTESFGFGQVFNPDFWVVKTGPELAAEGYEVSLPERYALRQNWPNPFNATTQIAYDVPRMGHVTLTVYDLLGREVMTLVDGVQTAGSHYSIFDGSGLASGVYFYRLDSGDFVTSRKMVLLK